MTSIKTRQIASVVVDSILNPDDQNQVDQVIKLTGDKFSENDNKAIFALINFILTSAGKFEADPDILESELQQLGLPREHAASIYKVYEKHRSEIDASLREQSFRLTSDLHFDFKLVQDKISDLEQPKILLNFKCKEKSEKNILMTVGQFRVFVNDLRRARDTMVDLLN